MMKFTRDRLEQKNRDLSNENFQLKIKLRDLENDLTYYTDVSMRMGNQLGKAHKDIIEQKRIISTLGKKINNLKKEKEDKISFFTLGPIKILLRKQYTVKLKLLWYKALASVKQYKNYLGKRLGFI